MIDRRTRRTLAQSLPADAYLREPRQGGASTDSPEELRRRLEAADDVDAVLDLAARFARALSVEATEAAGLVFDHETWREATAYVWPRALDEADGDPDVAKLLATEEFLRISARTRPNPKRYGRRFDADTLEERRG